MTILIHGDKNAKMEILIADFQRKENGILILYIRSLRSDLKTISLYYLMAKATNN
jgi:hypothetical protein